MLNGTSSMKELTVSSVKKRNVTFDNLTES